MSVTKSIIKRKISSDSGISNNDAENLFEIFMQLIKSESKYQKIKISNFGSFFTKDTIQRVGRNPKTKESYIIGSRKKLNFKSSNFLKKLLNS